MEILKKEILDEFDTSPIPEEAPVTKTIFPRMFSGKRVWNPRNTRLRNTRAGHSTNNMHNPTRGTTKFKKDCKRSIITNRGVGDVFTMI